MKSVDCVEALPRIFTMKMESMLGTEAPFAAQIFQKTLSTSFGFSKTDTKSVDLLQEQPRIFTIIKGDGEHFW